MTERSLSIIAADVRKNWPKVNYAAMPYLQAMSQLNSVKDKFVADDGISIVCYFLANAGSWRGPEAKRIKDELKAILKANGHKL